MPWPDYAEDPLWRVFAKGEPVDDPYNALLMAMDKDGYDQAVAKGVADKWLEDERWRGKKAFLALALRFPGCNAGPTVEMVGG